MATCATCVAGHSPPAPRCLAVGPATLTIAQIAGANAPQKERLSPRHHHHKAKVLARVWETKELFLILLSMQLTPAGLPLPSRHIMHLLQCPLLVQVVQLVRHPGAERFRLHQGLDWDQCHSSVRVRVRSHGEEWGVRR
mmetsp:Transcript_11883/g.32597  ORF Transcript_11883/g.32597 Transcript_11883/m.32597 type:complete len:139 (+) Transcript_11883:125-541(+)